MLRRLAIGDWLLTQATLTAGNLQDQRCVRRPMAIWELEGERSLTRRVSFSIQVNIPAESGDMGILANHVPSVEQLRPGLIEIIEENAGASKQYFGTSSSSVSSGIAGEG